MAQDPRTFMVADCDLGKQRQTNSSQQKRDFFGALGKLGDLSVLNKVKDGKVSEGLRTLTHVSNAIRTGRSVVPGREGENLFNTTLGNIAGIAADSIDAGATAVLNATGIGAGVLKTVSGINPGVANRAYGQAQQIYQQVKQGNFKASDIPGVFQDLQNLEILGRGIFTGNPSGMGRRDVEMCGASPYATDLITVSGGPKQKFMFVVQFVLNEPYATTFGEYGNGLAFVIKQSTRPTVEFEYEEINMYNYRTRVPKRTIYQPMTMSFYDDNANNVTQFYTKYLEAHSPISNFGGSNNSVHPEIYQLDSISNDALSSASFGTLQNNNITFINTIRLFHVFDWGRQMTVYNFYNPKILRLSPDELLMSESGNGSELGLEFAFDGLNVIPDYDLSSTVPFNIASVSGGAVGAIYPISPVFQSSSSPTSEASAPTNATNPTGTGAESFPGQHAHEARMAQIRARIAELDAQTGRINANNAAGIPNFNPDGSKNY